MRGTACQPGTVERLTGVRWRHHRDGRDQVALAAAAAGEAFTSSGIDPSAIDAIVHASAVPYQSIPATAPLVQRALGLPDGAVAAFDVNATCLGFLAALQLATASIECGRWRCVLIVCSELASRGLDWSDPATAGLFGDGAGAAIVAADGDGRSHGGAILEIALATYPSGYEASSLVAGGTRLDHDADPDAFERHRRFRMDGRELFALTRRHLPAFVAGVLERTGWTMDEVDCVVPHQASPHALRHMARALGVPDDRMVDIAATHGNQIAASLPIALDHARRAGMAGPGARVLLVGTAAGVTLGAATMVMGDGA